MKLHSQSAAKSLCCYVPSRVRNGPPFTIRDPFKLRYQCCALIIKHCDCSSNESISYNSIFSNATEKSSFPNNCGPLFHK